MQQRGKTVKCVWVIEPSTWQLVIVKWHRESLAVPFCRWCCCCCIASLDFKSSFAVTANIRSSAFALCWQSRICMVSLSLSEIQLKSFWKSSHVAFLSSMCVCGCLVCWYLTLSPLINSLIGKIRSSVFFFFWFPQPFFNVYIACLFIFHAFLFAFNAALHCLAVEKKGSVIKIADKCVQWSLCATISICCNLDNQNTNGSAKENFEYIVHLTRLT